MFSGIANTIIKKIYTKIINTLNSKIDELTEGIKNEKLIELKKDLKNKLTKSIDDNITIDKIKENIGEILSSMEKNVENLKKELNEKELEELKKYESIIENIKSTIGSFTSGSNMSGEKLKEIGKEIGRFSENVKSDSNKKDSGYRDSDSNQKDSKKRKSDSKKRKSDSKTIKSDSKKMVKKSKDKDKDEYQDKDGNKDQDEDEYQDEENDQDEDEDEDEDDKNKIIKDDEYMYYTPYYVEYIPDLTNKKIKEEIKFYLKRIEKSENDFKDAIKKYNEKEIFNDNARLKDEEEANKIYVATYDSNTKRYINNSKLIHKTVSDTVGKTTNLISGTISKGLELTVQSLPPIVTFLTSPLVLLIVSIMFIIGSFLFIMYIFGFKINVLNQNVANVGNVASSAEVAKIKPVYTKTETMYDKFINYLLSIQGIKNMLAIYNQYISYISTISGNNDIMENNGIDRKTIDSGRNDNIYNIKLSKYFKKDDNDIYSIIAPADFEIKYDDVKDFLTDFKKLPKNIQDNILKGNENIKLKWELDNTNKLFETNCKNFINNENKSVKLYKNCSIKEKYDNKKYDKTRVQLINNDLGNFE